MQIVELKVIFAVAVFITGIFGVLFPWALRSGRIGDRFMIWGDTFAGGVLGGTGLVHLLSNGVDKFQELAPGLVYPFAFVLAGAGFLLILLIEAVIVADPDPAQSPLHCGARGASHEIGAGTKTARWHPESLILLLVLSVHSIILGLALGAQKSVVATLIIFIAIIVHKWMAGFALGVNFRRAGTSLRRTVSPAAFFASMTPIGILTGTGINALISPGDQLLFEAIFSSLGAGTFLYIATLDIIRTEFELPGDRWQKWLLAAGGFSIMSVLAIWL